MGSCLCKDLAKDNTIVVRGSGSKISSQKSKVNHRTAFKNKQFIGTKNYEEDEVIEAPNAKITEREKTLVETEFVEASINRHFLFSNLDDEMRSNVV